MSSAGLVSRRPRHPRSRAASVTRNSSGASGGLKQPCRPDIPGCRLYPDRPDREQHMPQRGQRPIRTWARSPD